MSLTQSPLLPIVVADKVFKVVFPVIIKSPLTVKPDTTFIVAVKGVPEF
jgi:hypothetical protein